MYDKNYLLGIDLGTTNVKGILIDDNGNALASASEANTLLFPGAGMVEQDPHQWWENTVKIIRTMTNAVGPEIVKNIRGICISSQTVTLLPLDKNSQPLRNAIIWMDSRAVRELEQIVGHIGSDHYTRLIGAQPDVTFLPSKLLWYKNNEPELFDKTDCIIQASSYMNYKLTGEISMDIDQAIKSQCLNIHTLKWCDEVSAAIGVNLNKLLPAPRPVNEIIGTITEAAARETGLVPGIPVACGASDAVASMYATGISRVGEAGESSGTSSLIFAGHSKPSAAELPVVAKPCPVPGIPYVFDAPINATGASIKWYIDTFGRQDKEDAGQLGISIYDQLNLQAAKTAPGSNGVLYFPYMTGARAPLWNSYARGMFIGMSLDTDRADLIRAIFEGTAFALRHVIGSVKDAGADIDCLRITGGGAKSRTWSQIKAAMLRVPVHILDDKSGDVPFGDALIAGNAAGIFNNLAADMKRLIKVQEIIEPDEAWAEVYDKLYPYYVNMYADLDARLKDYAQTVDALR